MTPVAIRQPPPKERHLTRLDAASGRRGSLRGGRRIIALLLAAAMLGAGALSLAPRLDPVYSAEARVLVERDLDGSVALPGLVQLLGSRDFARRVASRLVSEETVALAAPNLGRIGRLLVFVGLHRDPRRISAEERAVDVIEAGLDVRREADRTITLKFRASEPALAARIVNAAADEYAALPLGASASQKMSVAPLRVLTRAGLPSRPVFPDPLVVGGLLAGLAALSALLLAWLLMRSAASPVATGPRPLPPRVVGMAGPVVSAARQAEGKGQPVEAPAAPAASGWLDSEALYGLLMADGDSRIAILGLSGTGGGRRTVESLSRQATNEGSRVVVVGMDTSAGGRQLGLADLILGDADFTEIIRRNPFTRAHEIGAGLLPIELAVTGDGLKTMLAALEQTYDLVLMDLGEMRADPVVLAALALAEQAILVGPADAASLGKAKRLLADAGISAPLCGADLPAVLQAAVA